MSLITKTGNNKGLYTPHIAMFTIFVPGRISISELLNEARAEPYNVEHK